ncbi:MAG: amidohydrolase family protein [Deltaproteobacteria bacterium]
MTPRRAWLAATLLAVILLGSAVALATLLEPHTRDFDRTVGLSLWKIDFHQQIDPEVMSYAVNLAASQGIQGLVNLAGGRVGGGLERQIEAAARFPGRVLVFLELDERGCCDEAWVNREVAQVVAGQAAGARGVYLPRPLVTPDGTGVPLDAPLLDPLWQAIERLALPVAFDPGTGAGPRQRLERLLERQPRVRFVALGMAGMAAIPVELGALLARSPNLYVDTAGALPALSRDRTAARDLLVAHADRVLLGTDLSWLQGPRPDLRALVIGGGTPVKAREPLARYFDSTWRFLDSGDPDIPGPVGGDPVMQGLALPREALDRIYRGNARALLGFGDLGAR